LGENNCDVERRDKNQRLGGTKLEENEGRERRGNGGVGMQLEKKKKGKR